MNQCTAPISPQNTFVYSADQASQAARLWFAQRKPSMTLGAWRDHLLNIHLTALQATDWRERIDRSQAWNEAFARGVAANIAEGARHE